MRGGLSPEKEGGSANLKSTHHIKGLGPQIAYAQIVTFAEGPQICGFWICGPALNIEFHHHEI